VASKEKIQQFFELLDGMALKDWKVLREKADYLFGVAAIEATLSVSPEHAQSYAEQVEDELDTLKIVRKAMAEEEFPLGQ